MHLHTKFSMGYQFTQREREMKKFSAVLLLFLLLLLCVMLEVHSQTYPFVRLGRNGPALSNHSYLNLTTVGDDRYCDDCLRCMTDLGSCCSRDQGDDRGDWYFPNGTRVETSGSTFVMAGPQRVELRRRNNAIANGIYQCTIETNAVHSNDNSDTTTREIVYVGLYASGGKYCLHT